MPSERSSLYTTGYVGRSSLWRRSRHPSIAWIVR